MFFEVKNLIFVHLSEIWKFDNPCDKIGRKRGPICILHSGCDKKLKFDNYGFT